MAAGLFLYTIMNYEVQEINTKNSKKGWFSAQGSGSIQYRVTEEDQIYKAFDHVYKEVVSHSKCEPPGH